jgi:hypothetical protein
MGQVSVDLDKAKAILESAWEKINDKKIKPGEQASHLIEKVLLSGNVTFKYILVTGLLGKCANPAVHPRSLQTGSTLVNSYDARSLCHKVIVTFEKGKGDLWGLSNEPFVNKPARHPEHDKDNKQLRDKELAAATHDALELSHHATANEVFSMLVYACRLGKQRADEQVVANFEHETTYARVLDFVEQFLRETDGGARLASVVGAFVRLLNHEFKVKVYSPNVSDTFAKTSGDVEVYDSSSVVSAFECKHRPLSLDDVRHGIRKARDNGVAEYCFIYASGIVSGQDEDIRAELKASLEFLDVQMFDIMDVVKPWATALNPIRRGRFGICVTEILGTEMRRVEIANQAAALWNANKSNTVEDSGE